ncbi:MAG: glucuronosyltransferase [Planctomycetes bacterium]|nr:glucuronosyltransferase [Planctomycetota bacterium]
MILVTVGSEIRPFTRLLAAMDALAPRLGEPVVMQSGRAGPYPGRNTHCLGYLTFGRMQRLVARCRAIVGQGSTGAVLMARRYGKPLVLVPRDPALGETFDDHQLQTAHAVEGRSRMIEVVYDIADLEAAVRRAQAKADQGLTYEPDPEREHLLAAIRAAVEGRELPDP